MEDEGDRMYLVCIFIKVTLSLDIKFARQIDEKFPLSQISMYTVNGI